MFRSPGGSDAIVHSQIDFVTQEDETLSVFTRKKPGKRGGMFLANQDHPGTALSWDTTHQLDCTQEVFVLKNGQPTKLFLLNLAGAAVSDPHYSELKASAIYAEYLNDPALFVDHLASK